MQMASAFLLSGSSVPTGIRRINPMRHTFFVVATTVLLVAPTGYMHAQTTHSDAPKDSVKHRPPYAPLFKGIQLSRTQSDSMQAIWNRFIPLEKQINEDGGGAKTVTTRMLALIDQRRAAMRVQLTPDQRKTFDKTVEVLSRQNEAITKQTLEAEARLKASH
jgi:hypothetical protein